MAVLLESTAVAETNYHNSPSPLKKASPDKPPNTEAEKKKKSFIKSLHSLHQTRAETQEKGQLRLNPTSKEQSKTKDKGGTMSPGKRRTKTAARMDVGRWSC